eukprot:snap_masked-scaffold_32-processed-gene-2.7-mRNA-1 protein AED:0.95 eAED:1.00 QI:0/-1/0/1/-1/1/1/0/275
MLKSLVNICLLGGASGAFNLKDHCFKQCQVMTNPAETFLSQELHKIVHAQCAVDFRASPQVGQVCRQAFHDVGITSCALGCETKQSGLAIRNRPEIINLMKHCDQRKFSGSTSREIQACKNGITKGTIHFSGQGVLERHRVSQEERREENSKKSGINHRKKEVSNSHDAKDHSKENNHDAKGVKQQLEKHESKVKQEKMSTDKKEHSKLEQKKEVDERELNILDSMKDAVEEPISDLKKELGEGFEEVKKFGSDLKSKITNLMGKKKKKTKKESI